MAPNLGGSTYLIITGDPQFAQKPRFANGVGERQRDCLCPFSMP